MEVVLTTLDATHILTAREVSKIRNGAVMKRVERKMQQFRRTRPDIAEVSMLLLNIEDMLDDREAFTPVNKASVIGFVRLVLRHMGVPESKVKRVTLDGPLLLEVRRHITVVEEHERERLGRFLRFEFADDFFFPDEPLPDLDRLDVWVNSFTKS